MKLIDKFAEVCVVLLFLFFLFFLPFLAVGFFIAGLCERVEMQNQSKSPVCLGNYTMRFDSEQEQENKSTDRKTRAIISFYFGFSVW